MATPNPETTKVSLAKLQEYDGLIKQWVLESIDSKRYVILGAKSNFPVPGDSEVLYIDTSVTPYVIYAWSLVDNDYVPVSGESSEPSTGTIDWGSF